MGWWGARSSSEDAVQEAMASTPRAAFLPADQQPYADVNRALPIGYGQTNSQPTTVRDMLRALRVEPGHRVLDVGAGSGWTTAILGRLVGPTGEVVGVERIPELTAEGAGALARTGMAWARIRQADRDVLGCPEAAPFDRILVSAQGDRIPGVLLEQLDDDGLMVLPVGGRLLQVRKDGRFDDLGAYVFVPLVTGTSPAGESSG